MELGLISPDQFRKLCIQNPCETGTPAATVWMLGVLKGANNQTDEAPTDDDIPAYHEGWEVGQAWFNQNHQTDGKEIHGHNMANIADPGTTYNPDWRVDSDPEVAEEFEGDEEDTATEPDSSDDESE